MKIILRPLYFVLIANFILCVNSKAYTVTDLAATCSNGQVFLTWTNPDKTNLQYNVYRSLTALTQPSQLTPSKCLGFVRDSSSKNIHLSRDWEQQVFFRIKSYGSHLSAAQGLYAVTCTNNARYFYAVTITDLSTGIESRNILAGRNSVSHPVTERVSKPQPVFQDSVITKDNGLKKYYTQFVSNQETNVYPAMVSTGSYGFNFYLAKKGIAESFPLIVKYEGDDIKAEDPVGIPDFVTNCYVLGVDDWLPVKEDHKGTVGDNTYFCGYYEHFNIYTDQNPVPESGTIKLFSQRRYIEAIRWVKAHFNIDTTRVYTKGTSACGYGAILTALLYPKEIAAVQAEVEPPLVGVPNGVRKGDVHLEMWGDTYVNLSSDALDPITGEPLPIYTILNLSLMTNADAGYDLPLIYDLHGKNDPTVKWSQYIIDWFGSLQSSNAGGVFYWDQRKHTGYGSNFLDSEVTPHLLRYQTTKSFPAFSNCSINQNPGNGNPHSGDDYGAINGYLDWNDSISDLQNSYSINVMIKEFYVGGLPDQEQYSTCISNVTFRRLQNFKPKAGTLIYWKNSDASNTKIQSGSFIYNGGFMTLTGIIINKSGNCIQLYTLNHTKEDKEKSGSDNGSIVFIRSGDSYIAEVTVDNNCEAFLSIYDLSGRLLQQKKVFLSTGINTVVVPNVSSGIYFVQLKTPLISYSQKLFF